MSEESRPSEQSTPYGRFLPDDDLRGRIASVLIGSVFTTVGCTGLAGLIVGGRGLDWLATYELMAASTVVGLAAIGWGLFLPHWLESVARRAAAHLFWIVKFLVMPILLRGIYLMFTGEI